MVQVTGGLTGLLSQEICLHAPDFLPLVFLPTGSVELDQLIKSLPINTPKNQGSELGPLVGVVGVCVCVGVCVWMCVCVCVSVVCVCVCVCVSGMRFVASQL